MDPIFNGQRKHGSKQPTSSSSCDGREDRDAFESYARKLAEAGIPLDRIAEGLSMAAVRAEVAHREDLMQQGFGTPSQVTPDRGRAPGKQSPG